jgi:hypothetical protein
MSAFIATEAVKFFFGDDSPVVQSSAPAGLFYWDRAQGSHKWKMPLIS